MPKDFDKRENKSNKIKESISEQFKKFNSKKHMVKPVLLVTLLILLQVAFVIYIYNRLSEQRHIVDGTWEILTFVMIIYMINLDRPIDFKVPWIILIAIVPVFGILLYLFLEILPGPKLLKRELNSIKESSSYLLVQDREVLTSIEEEGVNSKIDRYLYQKMRYPIYNSTSCNYFPIGEDYFENLKMDLLEAKEFIFIEYFIVRPGKMMDELLEILADKVDEGVEVKLMYDGMNDYFLPDGFYHFVESLGIEVKVFAPVRPILSTYHNNRDHRKIVVIDNKVGYTGGLNISDEYINEINRFGHWKDNGIRIEGDAVRSLTVMFLNLWNLNSIHRSEYKKYLHTTHKVKSNAFVQPYDDAPNDIENVGENVYVDILNQAKDYVYIMTPYLILSENIKNAIVFAAKRGVDVQLMMPGIPDKKIPFMMGRTYYDTLSSAGVKIFEYVPGFLHAKSFVADGYSSVVGTVNLDFRSLHLHYENGILVYSEDLAREISKDFLETKNLCREMTKDKYREFSWLYRYFGRVLRIIAPLM